MKRRLLIITEIIAPYRIPVFNALAASKEVELHVIFLSETDASLRQWRVYSDEIQFSYEVLQSFRRRVRGFNVLLTRGVSAALARANSDVIVAGGYNYVAMWEAKRWAGARGIPLVLWSESNSQDARKNLWPVEFAKRKFIDACHGYVVPGKAAAEYLSRFGVVKDHIYLAPNAVDVERFANGADMARRDPHNRQRLGLPAQYFLYVGRFVKSKGIYDLLNAYAKLPEEIRITTGLVFLGDGEERVELMRECGNVQPGRILFPGFVQRDDLPGYYANATALVFPSHSDPWGLVVNEAMACGIPVIATDAPGCTADLVCDGVNGYVCASGSAEELAQAMMKLVKDPDGRGRMCKASAATSQGFTPEAWAHGMVRAIEAVAECVNG